MGIVLQSCGVLLDEPGKKKGKLDSRRGGSPHSLLPGATGHRASLDKPARTPVRDSQRPSRGAGRTTPPELCDLQSRRLHLLLFAQRKGLPILGRLRHCHERHVAEMMRNSSSDRVQGDSEEFASEVDQVDPS